jgi:Mg-chelatase subunit ChlD
MKEHMTTLLLTIAAAFAAHGIVSLCQGQPAETTPLLDVEKSASPKSTTAVALELFIPDAEVKVVAASKSDSGSKPVAEKKGRARLDLAFCIDTTGSMQAEIDTVKAKVKSMVDRLSAGQPKPVVRVGLVAYRDDGDEYVTRVFPLSADIDGVVKDIAGLNADGGNDEPESVEKGLDSALNQLKWDTDKHTARVIYLIGDAPPHRNSPDFDLSAVAKKANAKRICINSIGCDGLGQEGVSAFKHIASLTNGKYEPLSYHQVAVDSSGKRVTMITSAGTVYKVTSSGKEDWKAGADALLSRGAAAPMLQGATNGTIGAAGSDATVICGVNAAGTVRSDNNLESVMLQGAQAAMQKIGK